MKTNEPNILLLLAGLWPTKTPCLCIGQRSGRAFLFQTSVAPECTIYIINLEMCLPFFLSRLPPKPLMWLKGRTIPLCGLFWHIKTFKKHWTDFLLYGAVEIHEDTCI